MSANCWEVDCWNGWGPCASPRAINAGPGNLFVTVQLADGCYMTAFSPTGWELAWFEAAAVDGVLVPDFVNALAYLKAPQLTYGGQPCVCIGGSGSQYGDASRVPGLFGESVVWYQLNYVPISDPTAKPYAALARVVVRDDSLSAQEGNPDNRSFTLSHCWIVEDENGDPFYFDSALKLCNYHSADAKTCVGPGHFVYQRLRVSGKHQLRYWTPGVTQAAFTEWDDPNDTINTSGWKGVYCDSNCFPAALGTRASTIDVGATQTAHRDFIAGLINPASGAVSEVDEWTNEDALAGTQHVRIDHLIDGAGGSWAELTYDAMRVDVIDWKLSAAAGGLQKYFPDDLDESEPIYCFDTSLFVTTGRHRCSWQGYTLQATERQLVTEGVSIHTEGDAIDPVCVKGLSYGGAGLHVFNATWTSGVLGQYRAYGVTTNGWAGWASSFPSYLQSSDGFSVSGADEGRVSALMYDQFGDGIYYFQGDPDARLGEYDIPINGVSGHSTVTPVWGGDNFTFYEDSIGWYMENKPPATRWLSRASSPQEQPFGEEAEEWYAWVVKLAHTTGESIFTHDGGLFPTLEKALWIAAGDEEDLADDLYVKLRGVYWEEADSDPIEADIESFCYAGVRVGS